MSDQKPYCACATPPGQSGLAVIRMAGQAASRVADRCFKVIRGADAKNKVEDMRGYTAAYGIFCDPQDGHRVDEVICLKFSSPHTYTGEETVEFICHGGIAVRQEMLKILIRNGARPAEPGEFTKNAFLSGRLDLSQAEAVMDIISAQSDLSLRAAQRQLAGALRDKVRQITDVLYEQYALLEMMIEYPEHEDTPENAEKIVEKIDTENNKLRQLLLTYDQGKILKEGMTVVICGLPNSGKSSLFNLLSGYDRAIVTSVPGTTRDTLEVFTAHAKVPLRLIDTAGLRETQDEVEKIGVERARQAIGEADLILWLIDATENEAISKTALKNAQNSLFNGHEIGLLLTKADLTSPDEIKAKQADFQEIYTKRAPSYHVRFCLAISTKTKCHLASLGDRMYELYEEKGMAQADATLITSERHAHCLRTAADVLEGTGEMIKQSIGLDLVCARLRSAMDALGQITGDHVSDTLVKTIFSRFCIGK